MFNINNESWGIILVAPTHPKLYRSDGSLSIGTCDDRDKLIYINDALPDVLLKKVLCHEITHAAMFSYNVELTIEQEEIVADIVATYGQEIIKITNDIFKKLKGVV